MTRPYHERQPLTEEAKWMRAAVRSVLAAASHHRREDGRFWIGVHCAVSALRERAARAELLAEKAAKGAP